MKGEESANQIISMHDDAKDYLSYDKFISILVNFNTEIIFDFLSQYQNHAWD